MIADGRRSRTTEEPRYRGVSYTTPINAAKEAVRVLDLADLLCGAGQLRRVGRQWVGHCPLPDHEDKTPSFTVDPQKNVWFCHGCLRGGDVVELARYAWGFDQRDAHQAAARVLQEWGLEIPARPQSWFDRQHRQKEMRDLIRHAKAEVLARRLWRAVFVPILADLEDPEERVEAARRLWPMVYKRAQVTLEIRAQEIRSRATL